MPSPPEMPDSGRISPNARRLAQQLGLDVAQVAGTGPQGRVTEADVLEFVRSQLTPRPPEQKPATPPSPAPVSPSAAPSSPNRLPPPPNFSGAEQTERLLTMANIQFRRGQTAEAEKSLAEVLQARPRDAAAHELMADIKLARGDFEGGQSALKTALELEPGRATAEAKLARAALRRTEQARMKSLGVAYAGSDAALVRLDGGSRRGGPLAALASAVLPGLGQFLLGQATKGVVLLSLFGLGLLLLAAVPGAGDAVGQMAVSLVGGYHRGAPASGLSWFVIVLLSAVWLYAIIDAGLTGRRAAPDS